MTADDRLDQEHWQPGGVTPGPQRVLLVPTDRTTVRAQALHAACVWLAGIDPFPQGRALLLESAEEFAAWIEGESHACNSLGSAPESPSTASNTARGYADTGQTGEGHTATTIDDGFGNYWENCHVRCSQEVVRPGKAQCQGLYTDEMDEKGWTVFEPCPWGNTAHREDRP